MQERAVYLGMRAALHRAEGKLREALADVRAALETVPAMGLSFQTAKQAIVEGVEAALALGDTATAEELLTMVERTHAAACLRISRRRRSASVRGSAGDAARLAAAAARFQELGLDFWHAVATLEQSELDGDVSGLDEAREVFERLRARPWLERAQAASAARAVPA